MTQEEAIKEIKEKYDIEALRSILRFSEKHPSMFEWDDNKEYVDIEDILYAFTYVVLHKHKELK